MIRFNKCTTQVINFINILVQSLYKVLRSCLSKFLEFGVESQFQCFHSTFVGMFSISTTTRNPHPLYNQPIVLRTSTTIHLPPDLPSRVLGYVLEWTHWYTTWLLWMECGGLLDGLESVAYDMPIKFASRKFRN